MISLWSEASRDVEAEETERRRETVSARLDSAGFLQLMAHVKSPEEYDHYKSLVKDSISAIAAQYNSSPEEVTEILDQKMSYILEANQLKEAANGKHPTNYQHRDRVFYVILDGQGRRVGGSYSTAEAAKAAIASGKFRSSVGLRVVPSTALRNTASRQDPFQVLAGLRQALREGSGPVHRTAAGENPNTPQPSPGSTNMNSQPAQIGGDNPDLAPTEQTPSPEPRTASFDDRFDGLVEEISRYNPHLSEERVVRIAAKVMGRFYDYEEEE